MASVNKSSVASSDTYRLSRGEGEPERLNLQHTVYAKAQGYLIKPDIAKKLGADCAIADIACGTGAWLVDVAKTHGLGSSSSLHAFDISDVQFPPKDKRPPNIHFHVANMKDPFPEEFLARFDVVHVRLVLCAFTPSEWMPAVQNLMTLLKPGVGYLHWEEALFGEGLRPRRGLADSSVHGLRRAFSHFASMGWGPDLLEAEKWLHPAFLKAGLQDVDLDFVSTDRLPEMREVTTRNTALAMRHFFRKHTLDGGEGALSMEENEKLVEGMFADIQSGGYITYGISVLSGRSP